MLESTGGTGIIGFEDGIILSSGKARDVVGPNNSSSKSTSWNTGGDSDLSTLTSVTLRDAAVLEFDFIPNFTTLSFNYVFSSEEYNEYVGSINDIFGLFVNGVNQAILPTTETSTNVVSINNVNLNLNSQFYINNDDGALDTQMDGLTTVLTVSAQVNPGVSNHIKIAIADASDTILDSNVFIQAGSFGGGLSIVESGGSTQVSEAGLQDSYTVALLNPPTADVTITLDAGPQLLVSTNNLPFAQTATLIFTSDNWNVPQTVKVAAVDDSVIEGDHSGVITHTATSDDPNFNGKPPSTLNVNITDNDFPVGSVTVTESGGTTDVAEGGATDTYTVVLDIQPNSNVTINLNSGTQLTVSPTILVFTTDNWNVAQTVTVTAKDDAKIEGPHTGTIVQTISTSSSNYLNVNVASVTAQITDNDFGKVILNPVSGVFSMLEGKTRTYTAVLNAAPAVDVTIDLSADPQLSLSTSALVFTSTNWNVAQTVTVTAIDNDIADGNRVVNIVQTVDTADLIFQGTTVPNIVATVIDDENTLVINGTDSTDKVSVLFSSGKVQAVVNGKSSVYSSNFNQVLILAGAGNDSIQLTNPTLPLSVLGGAGTDKLQIDGQTTSNSYVIDQSTITANGQVVTLGDVENVVVNGKNSTDTFTVSAMPVFALALQGASGMDTLNAPDIANIWTITGGGSGTLNSAISFSAVETLLGGTDTDTFLVANGKSFAGTIDGGGGENTLSYAAYKSVITANLATGTVSGLKGFQNISTLIGGSNTDKLIGPNTSNTWNITANNAGTVGAITFQSFESLTGGSADDQFVFSQGTALKGKIDGGGGSDTLDYSNVQTGTLAVNLQTKAATGTAGWLNIEQFLAGGDVSTIIGANKVNSWMLTGAGTGTVAGISFDSFTNLTGGTQADTFDASAGSWIGMIDGGVGKDTLLYAAGDSYVKTGTNAGTINGNAFKNIEIVNSK